MWKKKKPLADNEIRFIIIITFFFLAIEHSLIVIIVCEH